MMRSSQAPEKSEGGASGPFRRGRLLRLAVLGILGLLVAPALALGVRSYLQQRAVFFPPRRPLGIALAQAGLPAVQAVSFGAEGARLRGWYAPSRNRAAVLFVHGAGGDRSSLLPEARVLARQGFGVLLFDLPGHGESDGAIRWSEPERTAVDEAIGFLARRTEVDPRAIGAFGFSLGGYVLAQAASRDARIAAVVLSGTPADPVAQVEHQHGRYGVFTELPALFVLRRGGLRLDVRAVDFVARIAPRPLLVVAGDRDAIVPVAMAEQLFQAARTPKELFVIRGGDHGSFLDTGGHDYETRLLSFFGKALAHT